MATLRDLGVTPTSPQGPTTLRDLGVVANAPMDAASQQFMDQSAANGMGQLRKGFTSGLYGGDANALASQVSSLRASGRTAEADALMPQIEAANQRAATFAPAEPSLYNIGLDGALRNPGRVLDWGLGAAGQGTASMVEPIGAELVVAGAGKVLGALPWAPAKMLGKGLQYAAPLAAGALNYRQNKGEFVQDAWKDPAIMAKTPQEIENAAMVHGALAGSLDTALPHMVSNRLLGKGGIKALEGLSKPAKVGLDLLGEGTTETMQEGIKKGALSYLNPNRDKSGDLGDYVDSFAGGVAGAGPVSGLSHLAASGHARVATPDGASNDVSGKPAAPAPEDKSLKGTILKRAKEQKVDGKELDDWHNLMSGQDAEGNVSGATILAQEDAVKKELEARAGRGDQEAAKHLDTINNDPGDGSADGAVHNAATYIKGDGSPAARAKLIEAFNGRKKNEQGAKSSPEEELAARLAEDAVPERMKYESDDKGYFTNLRAKARDIGENIAVLARSYKTEKVDSFSDGLLDSVAHEAVDLWGGKNAQATVARIATALGVEKTPAMQQLQQALAGSEQRKQWNETRTTNRTNAAERIVKLIPTEQKLKLHKAGIDLTDPGVADSMLHATQKFLAKDSPHARIEFNKLMGGAKVADAVLNFVKTSKIEERDPAEHKPGDSREKDGKEDTTPAESDDVTQPGASPSDDLSNENEDDKWVLDGANKNMAKAPGAKLYGLRGETHLRDGLESHPFTENANKRLPSLVTEDQTDEGDGKNSLLGMQERAHKSLGGVLDDEVKQSGTFGVGSYRVRAVSAKEVMDNHRVSIPQRINLLRRYLAQEPASKLATEAAKKAKAAGAPDKEVRKVREAAYNKAYDEAFNSEHFDAVRRLGLEIYKGHVAPTIGEDRGTSDDIKRAGDSKITAAKRERLRQELTRMATQVGVEEFGGENADLSTLANGFFSNRFLVTAEQMAEKDQLRLNVAEVVSMIRHGAELENYTDQFGDTKADVLAGMNLIRFPSPYATAKDGIAVVPAGDLVSWANRNRTEFEDDDSGSKKPYAYRDSLMEAIGALVVDDFATALPHVINAKGKEEHFGNKKHPFPPSMKLGRSEQWRLDYRDEMRQAEAAERSAAEARDGRPMKAGENTRDARSGLLHQERMAKEQGPDPAVDKDSGVPDEFRHPGAERGAAERRATPPEAGAQGEMFEGGTKSNNGALKSYRSGSEIRQEHAGVPETATHEPRGSAERFWDAPELDDKRTDRADAVPSERVRKQKKGVPTEFTDQQQQSSVARSAQDKVETLTATNAMSRAAVIAGHVLRMFDMLQPTPMKVGKEDRVIKSDVQADPARAYEMLKQLGRALDRPSYIDEKSSKGLEGKDQLAGGKFYAAPLAHILTPKNSNVLVSIARDPAKAKATLRAMRGKVAQALLDAKQSEIAAHDRLTLAKLLTGQEDLKFGKPMKEALEKLLPAPKVEVKTESAAASAPRTQAESAAHQAKVNDPANIARTKAARVDDEPAFAPSLAKQTSWVADKLNQSLGALTAAIKGFTGEQLLALGDVMQQDVPAGASKVRWGNARQHIEDRIYDTVTAEQVLAHEAKTAEPAPSKGDVSEQARALMAEKKHLWSPEAFDDQGHSAYNTGVDSLLQDAEDDTFAFDRKTGAPNMTVYKKFMVAVEKRKPELKAFAQAVWDRSAAQAAHVAKADAFFLKNREALANHPDAMKNFAGDIKRVGQAQARGNEGKVWGIHADLMQQMFERRGDEAWRKAQIADKEKRLAKYMAESGKATSATGFMSIIQKEIDLLKANDLQGMITSAAKFREPNDFRRSNYPGFPEPNLKAEPTTKPAPLSEMERDASARKLNEMGAHPLLTGVTATVADTQSIMRMLGFKAAPPKFADVAGKLLADPNINIAKFVKDSAEALSHILTKGPQAKELREALSSDTWFAQRAKITANLVKGGMMRGDALVESYRVLTEQALMGELAARTKADQSVIARLMQAVQDFVSRFKEMTGSAEFADLVRNHLNKAVEAANTPAQLKEGYKKVSFQEAIDADKQSARVLAHMSLNPNVAITGSIVLAESGSIYRDAKNMLHDLDFLVTGTKDAAEAWLRKGFPDATQVYDFNTSNGKVDSFLVPPAGATIENIKREFGEKGRVLGFEVHKDGKVIGRTWNDEKGEHKEGDAGTFVDLFTNSGTEVASTIPFTVGGKQLSIKAANPAAIFNAKLNMGREKDMNDYGRYVPNVGRQLNEQAAPTAADIQSSANAAPKDEAIAKVKAYVAKVLGPKVRVAFEEVFDAAGEWIDAENLMKIALNGGPGMETVAHHEAMHAFFSRLMKHNPEAAEKLKRVLGEGETYERLKALLHGETKALEAMARDPEERVAYAFQFWAAGRLEVDKPATTMFAKFRRLLRKVFGMVRESETALDIMTAFHDGKLADENAAGKAIKKIMDRETWNEDQKRKADRLFQRMHYELDPSIDIFRKEDLSSIIRDLGNSFFTNPGEEADGQHEPGFINARGTMMRKFSNWLDRAVGTRTTLNDSDRLAVIEALQGENGPKNLHLAAQKQAYADVHALLERFHKYATSRGMKLEYISDYFPRVWDLSKLIEGGGKEKFAAMVNQSKYDKIVADMLAGINQKLPAAQHKTKEQLIEAMHRQLIDRNGVDENDMLAESDMGDLIFKPFFASGKERNFKWLDKNDVRDFLEKDLIGAMSRYLQQGVRAAEFSHKFGEGGQKLKKALVMKGDLEMDPSTGKLEPRPTYGPAENQMYSALAEKGIKGDEAKAMVDRRMRNARNAAAAMEGSLGGDISDSFRKASSAMIAYQNLRLLPLSLFAAFGDIAGIAARNDKDGWTGAYEAFIGGMKDVFANWKRNASDMPGPRKVSVMENIAEAIGAVDSHMFLEQVGKAHTSEFMTDTARNIGRKLFMVNGLTAWDRSMRVTATKFAMQFLERHKSLPDKQHSARWLAEVGLKPEDITLNADGKLVWDRRELAAMRMKPGMNEKQQSAVMEQATADTEKVHNALVRWVEGAVLSPNAGLRPSRASDPHFAVLYHLKQFTYAMHHVVLKRAWNEARQGNSNPIGALAGVIPVMIVSDITKGLLTGGGSLPDYMKSWNAADWIEHGANRGGLAGKYQLALDAVRDPVSIMGPTVEQFSKLVMNPGDIGKNLLDAVPGVRMVSGAASHIREVAD
jgi:hypothetical protein